jgi:hypothetical protein
MDSDSYINSETLSEGADLPAAALAYKIGSRESYRAAGQG